MDLVRSQFFMNEPLTSLTLFSSICGTLQYTVDTFQDFLIPEHIFSLKCVIVRPTLTQSYLHQVLQTLTLYSGTHIGLCVQ